MESPNHKIIRNFISPLERKELLEWVSTINFQQSISNHHINSVRKNLNGNSYMYDISKTPETKFISQFQSDGNVIQEEIPDNVLLLSNKISSFLEINGGRVFLQVVEMNSGGKVSPHYDCSLPGFVNYKCNISVKSDNYNFYVDRDVFQIEEGDLYCFEASLYRHWSDAFLSQRVLLSFGFVLTYEEVQRTQQDNRIRLSERIQKYFQNTK